MNQYVSDSLIGAKKSYSASTNVRSVFNQRIKKPSKSGNSLYSTKTNLSPPSTPTLCGFVEL